MVLKLLSFLPQERNKLNKCELKKKKNQKANLGPYFINHSYLLVSIFLSCLVVRIEPTLLPIVCGSLVFA